MRFDELVWVRNVGMGVNESDAYNAFAVRSGEIFSLLPDDPSTPPPASDVFFAYKCGRMTSPQRFDIVDFALWLADAEPPEEGKTYENYFSHNARSEREVVRVPSPTYKGMVCGIQYLNGRTTRLWTNHIPIDDRLQLKGVT